MTRLLSDHEVQVRYNMWLAEQNFEPVAGWKLDTAAALKCQFNCLTWLPEEVTDLVTGVAEYIFAWPDECLNMPREYEEPEAFITDLSDIYRDNTAAIDTHHGRPVEPENLETAVLSWLDTVLSDLASSVYDAIETTLPAALRD